MNGVTADEVARIQLMIDSLSLSRPQADVLVWLRDGERDSLLWYSHLTLTGKSLERRGLVERDPDALMGLRLTDRGQRVAELIA